MITTHVLDTARGGGAVGMAVALEFAAAHEWQLLARGMTDEKGRLATLSEGRALVAGTYRLTFEIGTYERAHGLAAPFFPEAQVIFDVRDVADDYHVPLLLSPFGYSTYRGT